MVCTLILNTLDLVGFSNSIKIKMSLVDFIFTVSALLVRKKPSTITLLSIF